MGEVIEIVAADCELQPVIVASHASDSQPLASLSDRYQSLRNTHFSVDIGTRQLAKALAEHLNAPSVIGAVGRLGIDCNRPLETAFKAARPSGVGYTLEQEYQPLTRLYQQFHDGIAVRIDEIKRQGKTPLLIDLHSFTRVFDGKRRDVDIGICDHRLDRTAARVFDTLHKFFSNTHKVRMDEPYAGTFPGMFIGKKYFSSETPTVTIEVCNDLIDTEDGQRTIQAGLIQAIRSLSRSQADAQ